MTFKIKDLTVKNFMSVGNATQAVNFDRSDLTLVLGENLDLGGDDTGARNGTGKTTILNALSFGLYGQALTNIKKDNLINKTNGKGLLVTVDFEFNGVNYRIERGRKPGIMKFFVDDTEKEITDDAQGDSRETQADIERMLGMSHEMFKHIVALNTYTEPFLSLRTNDQRLMIEQLLGITLLSEKADALKEQIKVTRDAITQEEFRIKAVTDANRRIEEQIENLKRRQALWKKKHDEDLDKLITAYDELAHIDIEAELSAHKALIKWNEQTKKYNEHFKWFKQCELDAAKYNKALVKIDADIAALNNHTCHACGQAFHDDNHEQVLKNKIDERKEIILASLANNTQWHEHDATLQTLGDLNPQPQVYYGQESDAFEHRSSMGALLAQMQSKQAEVDPYEEQIADMTSQAIEEIDYGVMNDLDNLKNHQEFLHKLLTNKDSFIRKRIIDQNLNYLNARLGQYLDRIGLPHTVKFNNDLTVSISELGRDLDFDNLSRGERNRLILSLSWSFRDVWESLYQPINLLFIDELVDLGMDSSGVENSLSILKKMSRDSNKSIWLVSHKDELAGRVDNTLRVIKENGYTSYDTDI